jgi:hypothetical protein
MASMSSTPPTTVHFNFTGFFWDQITDYTGIMDVQFDPAPTPSSRQEIEDLRGLSYFMAPGRSKPKAMNGGGVRGFIQEPVVSEDGQETVLMRFIDFWNDKKREVEFKKNAVVMLDGKAELVWEHLLASLRERGMVKRTEWHCKFTPFPTHFYGTEEDDRALWE